MRNELFDERLDIEGEVGAAKASVPLAHAFNLEIKVLARISIQKFWQETILGGEDILARPIALLRARRGEVDEPAVDAEADAIL